MSVPATIVDKLRNYEYEKRGCGDVVEDIYALIHHIAALEEEIDNLRVEAREKNAWEGRYNALLEEAEASRPPEIDDDGHDLPQGSIAIDTDGLPWGRTLWGWSILRPDFRSRTKLLAPENGPYTIVYTPTPKENTND